MKLQEKVVIIFVILINFETKVWGSFLNDYKKYCTDIFCEPSFDTNLVEFAKIISNLEFEKIGSDCIPDVEILTRIFEEKNEDINRSGFEILTENGVNFEEFTVETCDGYLVKFVRIPGDGPVVLINHGLLSSYVDFITAGNQSGLVYVLHKAGYDVWLTNCRGNFFSKKHTTLSPKDKKFWNFSWHEIGTKDLPAFIDFALGKTGKKQLIYIGHSQGTTSILVLLSEKPEYNKKMKLVILLSPIAFMGNAKSPFLRALAPFHDQIEFLFYLLGRYEILPRDGFAAAVKNELCYPATEICSNFLFLIFGFDCAQIDHKALPVEYSHAPSGAAVKQLIHYLQLTDSKKFRQYDYGKEKNLKVYGRKKPPKYNLTNVCAPVAVFRAKNDWVSSLLDVKKLAKKLPNVVKNYLVPFDKFNHLDYLWAKDVKKLLYNEVLELIDEYKDC